MPLVTFVQPDGSERVVDASAGWTLMDVAVRHGVPGIVAACGGACSCATCHVRIDPAWLHRLPPISERERELLAATAEPATARSRLACAVAITPEMVDLRLQVPTHQL